MASAGAVSDPGRRHVFSSLGWSSPSRARGVSRETVQVLLVQVALFAFELSGCSLAAPRRPPPFFPIVAEEVAESRVAVALRKRGCGRKEEEAGTEENLLWGCHGIYGQGQ